MGLYLTVQYFFITKYSDFADILQLQSLMKAGSFFYVSFGLCLVLVHILIVQSIVQVCQLKLNSLHPHEAQKNEQSLQLKM
jgi:hypothetical protein